MCLAATRKTNGAGPLSSHSPIPALLLEFLYWMCHPSTSGQSKFTKLVNVCLLNKWTVVGNVFGIVTFLISAAGAYSVRYMQFNVRMAISLMSCLGGVLILRKRAQLFSVIEQVAELAERAHHLTDNHGRAAIQKSATHSRVNNKVFLLYGGGVLLAAALNLLRKRSIWAEVLLRLIGGRRLAESGWNTLAIVLDWATTIEYQYNTMLDGGAIFVSLSAITTLVRSLAEVQTQINRGVQAGDSRRWAALQSREARACRDMEELIADLLPLILISAYFTPLLAIVDVVFNGSEADQFSVALSPVVLVVLWPMCEVGDALWKSRQRLCVHAYFGPWLDEPREQVTVRLSLMPYAFGHRGLLRTRGPGGGILSRRAFSTAITDWIKFLNALINLQNVSHH